MHFLLLLLAAYGFLIALLYTFGDFIPNDYVKDLHYGYVRVSKLIYQRLPWIEYASIAFQIMLILYWIQLNWFGVAALSVGCLIIYEIGMWRMRGIEFHAD